MSNLTTVVSNPIKVDSDRMISAKELHEFLGVKVFWSTWIKRRIAEYGFSQGIDFFTFKNENEEYQDFKLTLDMAKEVCMVERTDRGREARRYFIEVEKKWRIGENKGIEGLHALRASVDRLIEQEYKIIEIEERLDRMDGDTGYRTVLGYAREHGHPFNLQFAQRLGQACKRLCDARAIPIGSVPDERWGTVNSYPVEILNEIFQHLER